MIISNEAIIVATTNNITQDLINKNDETSDINDFHMKKGRNNEGKSRTLWSGASMHRHNNISSILPPKIGTTE